MNVFMGYNPLVAKQVKVSVWVKEIDGAEPILPATPKDGDCFIVFDTDDDVLADNPSLKKSYANGSWRDAGGGGGYKTAEVEFLLDGVSSALVYGAFADPSGYVSPLKTITSSDRVGSVICASNGAPSVLTISSDFKFTAKQGNIIIQKATSADVLGEGTVTIGMGSGK